jgi:hypothetical protein
LLHRLRCQLAELSFDPNQVVLGQIRPDFTDGRCGRKAEIAGIRASTRAGAARIEFHLYNTHDKLDALCDVLG